MNFIERWFAKKKAFKQYKKVLKNNLRIKFGKSNRLTYEKVLLVIEELGLESEFDCYAYAMYLSKNQYKKHQKITGVIWSQDALCIEVGVSRQLLKNKFPTVNYYGEGEGSE